MAVDPSMSNDDKVRLRRQLSVGNDLPTQVTQASPDDYAAAGMTPPTSARVAPYGGPSGNNLLPQAQLADPTGQVAMGGNTIKAIQMQMQGNQQSALGQVNAPAPVTAAPYDNISQSNLATANGLGRQLAPGITRYALGGDIAGPNATPIYTTRGKNGEAVFTDNAGFAAQQSTGGLRRGEVNSDVYNNAQPNDVTNPRANYEFAQSTLNTNGVQVPGGGSTGGLRRDQFSTFDPGMTNAALATAQGGIDNTDQGLSNRMDANLLRSRQVAQQQQGGGGVGGGIGGGNMAGIPVAQQIALANMENRNKLGQQRNAIAEGNLEETKQARITAQQNADRQSAGDFNKQYADAKQADAVNGTNNAATMLAARIPSDPAALKSSLQTDAGKQAALSLLNDEAIPGATQAPSWGSPFARAKAASLRFGDLSLDPSTGAFNGFRTTGDTSDGPTYPAQRGLVRRLQSALPNFVPGSMPGSFSQTQNYPATLSHLSPAQLQVLKDSGL